MKNNPLFCKLVADASNREKLEKTKRFYKKTLDGYANDTIRARPVSIMHICDLLGKRYNDYLRP